MSRHGYVDDGDFDDNLALGRWKGAVSRSIRGKRGQAFLRELLNALDAMPVKELVSGELEADGCYCALGVVGAARGKDLSRIDTEDWEQLAREFGVSESLAREIMWNNDEGIVDELRVEVEICGPVRPHYPDWGQRTKTYWLPDPSAPARRWRNVRRWVASQIKAPAEAAGGGEG